MSDKSVGERSCENCYNCQYIGDGDSVCEALIEICIVNWQEIGLAYDCKYFKNKNKNNS